MDKILFENKWMQVIDREGWTFYRLPWCPSGYGVAILPFRRVLTDMPMSHLNPKFEYEVLGRFEACAAHGGGPKLTAITGGLDKAGESPIVCAVRELEEEAGIRLHNYDNIIELGEVFDSKCSDHKTILFAVDMAKAKFTEVELSGDGTIYEAGSYAEWVSEEECMLADELRLAGMIGRLKALHKR
jgi:8-oxo-dGTP pyrophosphatase MutT (NUDIX family)